MNADQIFYLCPRCFEAFDIEPTNHPHAVLRINTAEFDAESRKPVMDKDGNLKSSAPRWFLEAIGVLPPHRPSHSACDARAA
jgi:hypothetical protein